MMPFLTDSIVYMVQKLMKMVVVIDVVDFAKSQVGLLKIDLHNRSSHLPDNSLKLPTGTLNKLRQLSFKEIVKFSFKFTFKNECKEGRCLATRKNN